MQNVTMEMKGEKGARVLAIIIHLDAKTKPSKSGKSEIIASTGGNIDLSSVLPVENGIKLGVNLYR